MKLSNFKTDYHRNGISGNGFDIVLFNMDDNGDKRRMVGILFEGQGNCAVLDINDLQKENIGFAKGNSWRGDHFELELRKVIKEANEKIDKERAELPYPTI